MRSARLFGLALACAACASPPTQLIVVVDTDLGVPTDLDELAITVTGPSGMTGTEVEALTGGEQLPSTLTVAPISLDALGPVRIEVLGRLDGELVVSRRAVVTLAREQTLVLPMFLVRACAGIPCDDGETCDDGRCVDAEVVATSWQGTVPRLSSDAGRMDGGVDGGPLPSCVSSSECPTDERGELAACSGFESTCDVDGMASRNVRSHACLMGRCVPSDRTETERCTRDVEGDGCGETTCTEWSACGGFMTACGTSGMQTRECVDRACGGGTCGAIMRAEQRACSRTTDGTSCGARTCPAFSACGYTTGCALTGTRSRGCTDHVCAAGACSDVPVAEMESCGPRATEGSRCNSALDCSLYECRSGTCVFVSGGCNAGEECCYPGCYAICP